MITYRAECLDDLLRDSIADTLKSGAQIAATKGSMRELFGVTLVLDNPRNRLSRSESRGKLFSSLGELFWYLSGSNSTEDIQYYISAYKELAENGVIWGGYGPRLFGVDVNAQFDRMTKLLESKPSSRQAVIQVFSANDIVASHLDVPCTCVLQFSIREGRLNLTAYMRSNDAVKGAPHDFFCFTMLQEIMARRLGCELGIYTHIVGSFHVYDDQVAIAERFLDEGWQATDIAMPPMPEGSPNEALNTVCGVESKIRNGESFTLPDGLDAYWRDLITLLEIFKARKSGSKAQGEEQIRMLRAKLFFRSYDVYVQRN